MESELTMTKTIVALFDDIAIARQVVEDLVAAGFPRDTISLITNDAHNEYSHYLDKGYAQREDAVTAGEGAGFGAVVGALTGVLVSLVALTIPGIGLVIVAGPIIAGLTGAVAGALTGGVVGALVKSGVPEEQAQYYAEGIRRGGTLISIETSEINRAQDIMNRNGSINIHERINLWRQDGWKGFDAIAEAVENEDTTISPPETITAITTPTIPPTSNASPITLVPVESVVDEEPQIGDNDTATSLPVMVTAPTTDTPLSVTPIPDTVTAEPIPLVVETEPQITYKDTVSPLSSN
jgi:hypothetical protein